MTKDRLDQLSVLHFATSSLGSYLFKTRVRFDDDIYEFMRKHVCEMNNFLDAERKKLGDNQ